MGTSKRWGGPRVGSWGALGMAVRAVPNTREAEQGELDRAAGEAIDALHETLRGNAQAFGLVPAAQDAGERLLRALRDMEGGEAHEPGSTPEEFLAWLTDTVGGGGSSITDAAVRRAATSSGDRLLRELGGEPPSGRLAGDLLCLLYQWFFADIVAEFLRAVVTMNIKLAVPIADFVDPEDRLVGRIADRVVDLVGNPCEEAEKRLEAAEQVADAIEEPEEALADVAAGLLPKSIQRVLGLVAAEDENESEGQL